MQLFYAEWTERPKCRVECSFQTIIIELFKLGFYLIAHSAKFSHNKLFRAEHNRAKELHRLAYPERYRLSSGAELVSGWIPNRMYPNLSITTLFHGNEFKNSSYNLSQSLLDKYDSGAITLHELVNELFEPWEQVDESQHSLLAVALQTAAGGVPTPHVGTGAGGSSSDLPWNDNDKDKFQRSKSKRYR